MGIVRNQKGKWEAEVTSTFEAYQLVRLHGVGRLRHSHLSISGRPLVMRLLIDDTVRLMLDGLLRTMRVATVNREGRVYMCDHQEANVDARNRDKSDSFAYVSKRAGSLQAAQARRVIISPDGKLHDPGFKD